MAFIYLADNIHKNVTGGGILKNMKNNIYNTICIQIH